MRLHPRIRTQAYLVGALPLAFLVLLLVLGLLIQGRNQASASLEQRAQGALGHIERVRMILEDESRTANQPPAKLSLAQLASLRRQISGEFRALAPLVRDYPGAPARLSALEAQMNLGSAMVERYASLRRSGRQAQARALAREPATQALSVRLGRAYNSLISLMRRDELHKLALLRSQSAGYEIALILSCAIGIVVTLLVSGQFGMRIAQRLGHLAENARRLAAGKPAAPLQGSDEFADLDVVYQTMMRQIAREQQLNATLQRMLLPQQLPSFDGIRIDTAYVPAAQEAQVGGDWYDAFPVADRCICIGIGDVAGHGLHAASVMASARLAVRTAARMQNDPAAIMAHINRVICADEPETIVTAMVAMLDIDDGTLRYAVAGHPEPIVIRADGELEMLPGKGIVLGADANAAYETFHATLHEGWALLLYTDGLVELDRNYVQGLDELAKAASIEYASSTRNIAEAIQQRVFGSRQGDDDTAVLFLGITRLGLSPAERAQRSWVLDARDPESAHRAKRAILWHLGDTLHDRTQLANVELVLGELIGNVARHSPGLAEISLEQQDGSTLLRVRDRGRPFSYNGNGHLADALAESGRGLFLVRAMAQDLRIEHNGTGNVVTAVLGTS